MAVLDQVMAVSAMQTSVIRQERALAARNGPSVRDLSVAWLLHKDEFAPHRTVKRVT